MERCLQTGKRCFTNRGRLFGFGREPRGHDYAETMVALIFLFLNLIWLALKSKSRLEAENAAPRHQLRVLQRKVRSRVEFTNSDRLFLVPLYRFVVRAAALQFLADHAVN
jgi:hypothetical protein